MTSRTRFWVLAVSTPIIAFAIIGGYLGEAMARNDTYQHLRVFQDVISLVVNNYVEPVDVRHAMRGAMRGLADGLDPDSAYLTPDLAKTYESQASAGPADVGITLARQYYLRVIATRPGSPAARAGLRSGDFLRAIDNQPTRDMSAYEGTRLLHGAVGTTVRLLVIRGNAADPHEVSLVRQRTVATALTSRMADATTGYVRLVAFTPDEPARLRQAVATLARSGATRLIVDLRGAAEGEITAGIDAARLFVKSGTLTIRQSQATRDTIAAAASDGALALPVVLLVDQGTIGAAEVFAAALSGNGRATLVGEHTPGLAGRQSLAPLPDGSGLLLTTERYLAPNSTSIHGKGLAPDIDVDQPDVDFGADPPPGDPTLDRALRAFP